MAEPEQQQHHYYTTQSGKPNNVLLLATLLPFGATLLILAALTLSTTVIALALFTPLFLIFSPVLLPASLVIALSVAGFLASGAFGITSLSSFAWLATYLRRSISPQHRHRHKSPALDDHVAHKAVETAQEAQKDTNNNETVRAHQENKASS